MNNSKNKNNRSKMILISCCLVALIAIVVICVVIVSGKDADKPEPGMVTIPYEDVLEESFDIETPYVTLSYPSKWKNEVEIKHVDADNYTVEFYRAGEDKETVHLFDIVFGGESGDFIGAVVNDDVTTDVFVVSYSIDNSISDDELEIISGMLEDVNHIILTLENNQNFKGL